jgi:MIP family channel proteins
MKDWQKYAAEVFGTFVAFGVGIGVAMAGAEPGWVAFAFGMGWVTALYTVGRVSGGHFNPALSLAAFLDRAISIRDLVGYWVAQFVGVLIAGGIFAWLFSGDVVGGGGVGYPEQGFGGFKAFSVEAILTLILTAAFLTLLRSQAHTKYLGMGLALFAVTVFGYAVTGAAVNPARWFSPAVYGGVWDGAWVYIFGPIVGAIAGWVVYRVVVRGDMDFTDDLGEIKDSVM